MSIFRVLQFIGRQFLMIMFALLAALPAPAVFITFVMAYYEYVDNGK
jgi:hypothetical protein